MEEDTAQACRMAAANMGTDLSMLLDMSRSMMEMPMNDVSP